ncbi:Cytidine deaminase [Metallosphaera sp. J1]|uniref:cytidine deaminase n=1 Tax=Metallosphaera TaxID=41980 RepID=UPI001EDE2711|nr:cytidine deaminase [Metallosphaera javensis (ex Hofmann et al. 2022)]MCG3107843.1 Cytidine deaminase [Metallosphaera javensis (ex Hofmann et al. 2022)]BCS92004.1 MAG: cytidine deaminase [Metallosphaera javensis (ex Sakai et al. 2022)]
MQVTDPSDEELLTQATMAASNSYSPYSGIRVGAALLGENGEIILGTNVENSSYGLSMCAERVAVFTAVARGIRKFKKIAVSLSDGSGIMPCGACRQVLREFGTDIVIVTRDKTGKIITFYLNELLPHSFVLKGENNE